MVKSFYSHIQLLDSEFQQKNVMITQYLASTQTVSFGSNETQFMKNCNEHMLQSAFESIDI